jgi:hypothetical protein
MSDDDRDNELRDAFGDRLTGALNLRSRTEAPAMAPIVTRRRAPQRVLVGALVVALLAGAVALIADRSRHTGRTIRPADTTTTSETSTSTTTPQPALVPVTAEQLMNSAPIGSLCGHPAGRLENGTLPANPQAAGFVGLPTNPSAVGYYP